MTDPTPEHLEIVELTERYLQRDISDAQLVSLNRLLASDPQLRRLFVDLCTDAHQLGRAFSQRDCEQDLRKRLSSFTDAHKPDDERQRVVGVSDTPGAPLSAAGAPIYRKGHEPKSKIENRKSKIAFSLAAVLLVACGVAVYLLAFNAPADPQPKPSQPGPPVATLIQSTGTVIANDNIANEGNEYAAGTYSIESGSAQFLLRSRVTVDLTGKTRLHMHNPMYATLMHGSAAFKCPPGAEGFTVHLPDGSRVIDQGTVFAVELDNQDRPHVYVIDGSVDFISASGDRRLLKSNQGLRVAEGTVQTYALPSGQSFSPEIRSEAIANRIAADPALITYVPFEPDADNAHRLVVYGSDGTLEGRIVGARWADGRRPGKAALRFGGKATHDRVELDAAATDRLDLNDSFTVAVWFRLAAHDTTWPVLIGRGDFSWRLQFAKDEPKVQFGTTHSDDSDHDLTAPTDIEDDAWHMAVAVFENGTSPTKHLYTDGERVATAEVDPLVPTQPSPVHVGHNSDRRGRSFNGWIDEIAVFSRALTAEEIDEIYKAGSPVKQVRDVQD